MLPELPIYVLDDDLDVCRSLCMLLRAEGFQAKPYMSSDSFTAELGSIAGGVVISDVCMPGTDGITLTETIIAKRADMRVIVITGHADVPLAVRALKAGARDFIAKPFESEALLAAVRAAGAELRPPATDRHDTLNSLSRREREVFACLVEGATNKTIAIQLGISPRTVETYRAKLMGKMNAHNLSHLVRLGISAGLVA